jgi:hypothetical protein
MSCQRLQRQEQFDHQAMDFSTDCHQKYAGLDQAYDYSGSMAEFQNKVLSQGYPEAQSMINRPLPNASMQNAPMQKAPMQHASMPSNVEDAGEINNKLNKVLASSGCPAPNASAAPTMIESMSNVNNIIDEMHANAAEGQIIFPLTRHQRYSPHSLGTQLLENYQNNSTGTTYTTAQWFFTIIGISALCYIVYSIYTKNETYQTSRHMLQTQIDRLMKRQT